MGAVALQVILSALAADAGVMTEVCPLDGTHFERAGYLTTGATSLRLDLRPVGRSPEPQARCPRCHAGGSKRLFAGINPSSWEHDMTTLREVWAKARKELRLPK